MRMETAALVGGLAFILIALVGGGFMVKDVHLPELPSWSRLVAGLLGMSLLVLSLTVGLRTQQRPPVDGLPSPSPIPPNPETTSTPSPNGSGSPRADAKGSSCGSLTTNAQVKAGPRHGSASATLVAVSYTLKPGLQMYIQLAGQVDGAPEPGTVFRLFFTGDPGTSDSMSPPHTGTTYFSMMKAEITPDRAGCWTTAEDKLGYPCGGGITHRFFLGLVPESQAALLKDLINGQREGVPIDDIIRRGTVLIDSFDVPSPKVPPPDCS